jgi:hypothetical protein
MNRQERRNLERQTRSPKFKKLMKKTMEERAANPKPEIVTTQVEPKVVEPTPVAEVKTRPESYYNHGKITGRLVNCHLCEKGDGTLMKYETTDGQKGYVHFKCADMMMKAIEKDRLEKLGIKLPDNRAVLPK